MGGRQLSPRALDLLDLSGGIYRVESQIALRPTNPAIEWHIAASVRDLAFWSSDGGPLLAFVLGFLNRARWNFRFRSRPKVNELAFEAEKTRKVTDIILFSGGMDSACGAGVHKGPREEAQLVGFYSTQLALQQALAKDLGYAEPTQWRLTGHRGKEGMDLIRAFMFLTLGAIVAESFGASRIFQYENGFLAAAIPPSGSFVPTRHAHPEFHRRMERLFESVFGRTLVIENPFRTMTKREVSDAFERSAGKEKSELMLRQTQTCWRLSQASVGGKKKAPWVPCGVCTPCIVRRTARPEEAKKGAWRGWSGYAYDLKKPMVRKHPKLGLSFSAYLELVEIALTSGDDWSLIEELAPEARSLIGAPAGPSVADAAALLRRFAHEFCETFEISVGKR
jgi:7-cyano-7-deazaguanine synthase in queuosine biosynthesis